MKTSGEPETDSSLARSRNLYSLATMSASTQAAGQRCAAEVPSRRGVRARRRAVLQLTAGPRSNGLVCAEGADVGAV
ncbi:hypothetical protein SACE_3179 [Saccharopolyspora erythraea NRRL 2338]|uniref:Uncharacterized protein n=1 Tax=Saccharopolyspora erythraea (strain ATCC 11635 / DSM 40517 / JCM 4748 / NBRC 13426 / NCIMB 8594 / NRRL 2338) TaxID=405948 RepID=A4FEI0_SACEN|nr:hypothetical protein SACE_3179 [Saccharopolyspora erythraea NRRL 2338]